MFNWFRTKNKNMVNSCFQPIYLKDGDEDWHKLYDVYWYFENGFYHIVPVIKSASIIRQENMSKMVNACLFYNPCYPNAVSIAGFEEIKNGQMRDTSIKRQITFNGNFVIHWE